MSKYQKAYIRVHTFNLVIFLTIFPKHFLFKWNERLLIREKLILKFHSKKNPRCNRYISKKILSKESVKFCFLIAFNIIISYIFLEIHQISQKIWTFTSSILTIFVSFLDFFTFTCYKKLMMSASIDNISSFFAWNYFR